IPPISTGSDCALGVTIRFAPRLRSSRFTRSPISSMTPSMAVATAVPMATAATVIALRRGDRRMDWLTKRRNMRLTGIAEDFFARNQLVAGNHELIAFDLRGDRDGIASAVPTDAGNEDSGGAILADHVGAFLIIALIAANLTGIERGGQRSVGALDDDEAHLAVNQGNRNGGGQLRGGLGVDEFGCDAQDEQAGGQAR